MTIWKKFAVLVFSFAAASSVYAQDDIVLKDQHPVNYMVKQGDTLWDIASRFLRDPWRWPDIWYVNPQIENPHLIYPGDEVVLTYKDGKPQLELRRAGAAPAAPGSADTTRTVKLSPEIRRQPLGEAVPVVPVEAISQFFSRPSVVRPGELDGAAYIVSSQEAHLIAGLGDKIYVRGLPESGPVRFNIVRAGKTYADRDGVALGVEALHVGEAVVRKFGDPATLEIVSLNREALVGDKLMVADERGADFDFVPHVPDSEINARVISLVDGLSRFGQYQVVVVGAGKEQGINRGHVLAVYQSGGTVRDKVVKESASLVALPDERVGYLMVFRVFDKVSYGLVMKSERDMRLFDSVRKP